ncbi:ribosome maturation factor RimM [Leuconostocaceae bacterium ESL0958]|nr:ribosome maturation factor RimM [Leuconostocaceae bacterium ESL0958]
MDNENYFKIGTIVNTHGIRGEVKVAAITDFASDRFASGQTIYRKDQNGYQPETVKSSRQHKQMWLLLLAGYDNINQVEPFKGQELYVAAADRAPLAAGEYYYSDIIGCTVLDEEGQERGQIQEIMQTGANDVWVMVDQKGQEVLLPVIDDVITEVDLAKGQIQIHVLEGLFDE